MTFAIMSLMKSDGLTDLDRDLARRFRRLAQRVALPLEVGLYALPALASLGFGLVTVDIRWVWLGIGAILLHFAILLAQGWWRGVLNDVEASKRAILDDTVAPIIRFAAGMHQQTSKEKEASFMRVARQAIEAALLAIDTHGVRAVVYSVNKTSDGLYVVDQNSRGSRPDAGEFPPGDPSTLEILEALAQNRSRFEPDNSDRPKREGRVIDYETYISAPIGTNTVAFGMLTVDALRAGDLTKQHINDVELIASSLAPAFAELAGARPPARPARRVAPSNDSGRK